MLNSKFAPWPSYTEEEASALHALLLSNKVNYWTGDEGRSFETEFAEFVGTKHAIALANGTVALDLALKSIALTATDEVIVTPRTFLASVSCVVTAGAKPVFADVDRNSQNITAESIEAVITERTKAIIVVHLNGMPADMDPIMELANANELLVIEDCAQAHGARYKGKSVGSIGHIGAWSFCQDKIMSTGGEGGMITLNDTQVWQKLWSYKDHGKSYDAVYHNDHPPGFRWLHDSFGTNWRMTEMQAVIGRIQLGRMHGWTRKRTHNAHRLNAAVKDRDGIRSVTIDDENTHAFYKWYCFVESKYLDSAWSRDKIVEEMNNLGVPCFQGSCSEVYLEAAFNDGDLRPSTSLKNAQELGENSICLLVHPTISDTDMSLACQSLSDVIDRAFKKQ